MRADHPPLRRAASWNTSPPAATRLSPAPRGRWISGIGRRTSWSNFPITRIRHGEAVAIGMALDVIYSRRTGLLDAGSGRAGVALLEAFGFDLFANELLHLDRITSHCCSTAWRNFASTSAAN